MYISESIISLVPKDLHKMRGSQISVNPKNFSKKFLKSPFFANFHDLMFTNAKLWHFLETVDLWYKRVGNP